MNSNLLNMELGVLSQSKKKLSTDTFIKEEKTSSIFNGVCQVQFALDLPPTWTWPEKKKKLKL